MTGPTSWISLAIPTLIVERILPRLYDRTVAQHDPHVSAFVLVYG